MTVNILGTEYAFNETSNRDDSGLSDRDGYCDEYTKVIAIETDYIENIPGNIGDYGAFKRKVKRHEIIHAYLAESGLREYNEDEMLVDWIAWQFPKMLKTFKEVDAI